VQQQYYMFTCAMERPFYSPKSTLQFKMNQSVDWIYGFKLFTSKGDYTVDFGDTVRSVFHIVESYEAAGRLYASALAAIVLINLI